MERRALQSDQKRWDRLRKIAENGLGFKKALANRALFTYTYSVQQEVDQAFAKAAGKDLDKITREDFLCSKLIDAVRDLGGHALAEDLPIIVDLCLEGQYSSSTYRRSFRSQNASNYVRKTLDVIADLIRSTCVIATVKERLYYAEPMGSTMTYLLACEIRKGNQEIIDLLYDAIMGDNSEILLTHSIVSAVIISGHEDLLNDLLKLFKAAKLQEGLRQNVLECADKGKTEVLIRILKLCLDEDMFRFSSVVRAFDTWTGLGCTDNKPFTNKKFAEYAYDCLTSEEMRKEYLDSSDNVKAFLALWAYGCHEAEDTIPLVEKLLTDPLHYRRVLGWFFVSNMDRTAYQMLHASNHLDERDEELLAWVVNNLAVTMPLTFASRLYEKNVTVGRINPALPKDKVARRELFAKLKAVAIYIGNQKKKYTGNPFAFSQIELSSEPVYNCMLSVAGYDMDEKMVDDLIALSANMTADQRQSLLANFLHPEQKDNHRAFLREALSDRSIYVKEIAIGRLEKCKLDQEDMDCLAEALRSKSSSLRNDILQVMQKQKPELIRTTISKMLETTQSYQNQAAIEMLIGYKDTKPEIFAENQQRLQALRNRKLPTQTTILLDQLNLDDQEEIVYSAENGYGLYDPAELAAVISKLKENQSPLKKQTFLGKLLGSSKENAQLLTEKELKAIIPTWEDVDAVLKRLDLVFDRHADYEYEVDGYDGSIRKQLLGDIGTFWENRSLYLPAGSVCHDMANPEARLSMLPFYEEFMEAFGEYGTDVKKMLGLYHVFCKYSESHWEGLYTLPLPWILPINAKNLAPNYCDKAQKKYKRVWKFCSMIEKLPFTFDSHEVFEEAILIYSSMVSVLGEENLDKNYLTLRQDSEVRVYSKSGINCVGINHRIVGTWRSLIAKLSLNDDDFARWFTLEYPLEQSIQGVCVGCLSAESFFRAVDSGIVPKITLYDFLLDAQACMPGKISALTNPLRDPEGKRIFEQYNWAREFVDLVLERIISVEEKRGELPTALTNHCNAIKRFEGARHFCNLLAALGKENFYRGYEYSIDSTKQSVLSRLLKRCYPSPTDTPEALAAYISKTDISDKRLAEAVMYAPQWAGIAEKVLNWPGLKSGVWLFHAHINEQFSAEKETETAIYSPISPLQFNDGAFDKNWFMDAYGKLGEKRFQILYKSAKYITSGTNLHRRSQLYSDAVLGKFTAEELEAEILDKRNQEKLRCYPLLPMAEGDTQEALRRYAFIQRFLKESKQFGAQRRDSEKKACATAMENLAVTTGIMDVNRLMWQMESAKMEEIRPLMEPVELDDVCVSLHIDENGDAGLLIEKNGKTIKTLPKSLNKHETILILKETIKELKEQKRRARESLERAMMDCTVFGVQELKNILSNPVLSPMLKKLLWNYEGRNGFLSMDGATILFAMLGESISLDSESKVRITHPHDLREAGEWAAYMRLLYETKLIQPFKQVFREYYPITADERQERTISRRYAGHQVNPKRTVALLKSRGWTVDYEQGLQKVYYKENLILRMYALADWFSPADIEAPTLETIEFFDRNTEKNVPLENVPPILFSEAMRDLDLVVSVAHVGGVDPEASHSTVEMRIAIAKELVALLKLPNVTWIGSHAKVQGKLANYSIHMGSGVVHAESIGMLNILPVHSQARGRIFLPFADDDPKTAEILSKIILLSEDKKLKDPNIIRQLMS